MSILKRERTLYVLSHLLAGRIFLDRIDCAKYNSAKDKLKLNRGLKLWMKSLIFRNI